jgi:diguanylate cyclase (GGDEF)-like protein
VIAVGGFLTLLRLHPCGALVARAVDDLGTMLAAAVACIATARQARRSAHKAARSWTLLAAATGSWGAGEAVWSYYELLAGRQSPFPSMADVGFLTFAVLAVVALMLWPSVALTGAARWRALLDGVLVAGSLFIITWVTALGAAAHASGTAVAWIVSVAYPVSDLVLITLTVIVVVHARPASRAGLGLLAAGLVCLCVADSGFAYLTSVGRYATGSPVDAGWFGGFLLIAVAATSARTPHQDDDTAQAPAMESRTRVLLPYLPAGLGLAVAVGGAFAGDGDQVTLAGSALVVATLLARQLLAVLDNRRLVVELVNTQQELHHQAFHDPLTGLANRALFADRLHHGLELHRRDLRPLSLLYCDLDGFKTINDTLGHDVGDQVIKISAERLRAVTRAADTVARLGGDEFGVLLEHGDTDSTVIVAHILDAFTQPTYVDGQTVALGISIGIAELDAAAAPITAGAFLHRADEAMYHAKRTAKGSAITWTDGPTTDPPTLSSPVKTAQMAGAQT